MTARTESCSPPARVASARYAERVVVAQAHDAPAAIVDQVAAALETKGLAADKAEAPRGSNLNFAENRPEAWHDIWSAGQSAGAIEFDKPSVAAAANLRSQPAQAIQRAERSLLAQAREPACA